MKNLLLPLCLALSPCLAQETVPDTTEPVVATTVDGQVTEATEEEVDDQWVAEVVEGSVSLMERITGLLGGLTDTASADEVAGDVADLCYCLISNTMTLSLNQDYAPDAQEYAEAVQTLAGMLKALTLADTKQSAQLGLALWGVRHLVALQEKNADTTAFAYYTDDCAYFIQLAHELNTAMSAIQDKAAADAAVEEVDDIITCLRELYAEDSSYGDDQDDCDAWLKLALGATRAEAEAVIRKCIHDCAELETPYYGSDALKQALLMIDVPYVYEDDEEDTDVTAVTDDQITTACGFMDRALSKIPALKEILLTIKDKETADAAAPQISAMRDEIDTVWADMANWMETSGVADALGDIVLARYTDSMKDADEVDALIAALRNATPAYYGSETLAEALEMAEDEQEASAEEAESE